MTSPYLRFANSLLEGRSGTGEPRSGVNVQMDDHENFRAADRTAAASTTRSARWREVDSRITPSTVLGPGFGWGPPRGKPPRLDPATKEGSNSSKRCGSPNPKALRCGAGSYVGFREVKGRPAPPPDSTTETFAASSSRSKNWATGGRRHLLHPRLASAMQAKAEWQVTVFSSARQPSDQARGPRGDARNRNPPQDHDPDSSRPPAPAERRLSRKKGRRGGVRGRRPRGALREEGRGTEPEPYERLLGDAGSTAPNTLFTARTRAKRPWRVSSSRCSTKTGGRSIV